MGVNTILNGIQPVNARVTTPTRTSDVAQGYRSTMSNVLQNLFPILYNSGPDVLFVMMSTMYFESSYQLTFGNPRTPNHSYLGDNHPQTLAYLRSPCVRSVLNGIMTDQTRRNIYEGPSAKSLMGTMGYYQVRGCSQHKSEIAVNPRWVAIAEENGILVNPGESPAAVFTGEAAPTRSMIFGCMIMESKYKAAAQTRNSTDALYIALQSYVGKAGAKGIHGESGAGRLADINGPNNPEKRQLAGLGINKNNVNGQMVAVNGDPNSGSQTSTNTRVVASTNNERVGLVGCA